MTKILLMLLIFNITTLSMGEKIQLRPSDFRRLARMGPEYSPLGDLNLYEPNCEELKAMWRFSTRQARAAELTNKIPLFKDPFAYNIWQKHPQILTLATLPRPHGRIRSKPVYGRVVYSAPSDHPRVMNPDRPKYYGVVRYFEPDEQEEARRNYGLAATFGMPNRRQKGSFDRLREMVFEERRKNAQEERPFYTAVDDNNPPEPAPAQASAPVPTPHPRPTPVPAAVPLPMKNMPRHVSRPYGSAIKGKERSDYIHPNNQDRSSRLKMISDYFNRDTRDKIGIDDDVNKELPNEDPVYGMPYRLQKMFLDDAPHYEF